MGFQTGFYRFPVRRSAPPRSSPATAQNAAGVPQNTAGMLLLTAVILLEPHDAGTKYTAIAIHGDEEGANSTRTWASTTIGAKADQLVTLAKKNARVRVGLTTILIIGKSGAPTTGNQHYRGPQPRHPRARRIAPCSVERRVAERRRHRKTCRTALGTLDSMRSEKGPAPRISLTAT
jgi:hypothetical protein